MPTSSPHVILLAGPNGTGKTTISKALLRGSHEVDEFVNADAIAQGLSGLAPERAALPAGKIMLARLHELADERTSFAFETTLASRTFAPWIAGLIRSGYQFHLFFLWLPNPEMAIERVAARVKDGGHHVDSETVRRRYTAGLRNFFELYQRLATTWYFYDNASGSAPTPIASGGQDQTTSVINASIWNSILRKHSHE